MPRPACADYPAADTMCYSAVRTVEEVPLVCTGGIYPECSRVADPAFVRPDTADILHADYWACDSRHTYFSDDQDAAEAAGRTTSDYCSPGTVDVCLGLGCTTEVSLHATTPADEGENLTFELRLSGAAPVPIVVTVSTGDDSAATHGASSTGPGRDYVPLSSHRVAIAAGDTAATFDVSTISDTVHEADETLAVTIGSVAGGHLGAPAAAVGTITNDDDAPVVRFAGDVTADEDSSIALRRRWTQTATGQSKANTSTERA